MKPFLSELHQLSELYDRLQTELSAQALDSGTESKTALLSGIILSNRDLLVRIRRMDARLLQVSREWEICRETLDPAFRLEVAKLAESLRNRAGKLSDICKRRIQQLELGRTEIQKTMEGVQTGSRYLASIKPAKTNYPKFVDSLG
jgi:hypothetical protein